MDNFPIIKTPTGAVAFSTPTVVRAFEPLYPFPENTSAIIYRERMTCLRAYYQRPRANNPHPMLPQVYFVDDSDFQDRKAGLIEWTRLSATLPNSWYDYESYAYTYPGYVSTRVPFTRTVTSRITKDYYVVGNSVNYQNDLSGGDDPYNGASLAGVTGSSNVANIPMCAGGTNAGSRIISNFVAGDHYLQRTNIVATGTIAGAVFVSPNSTNRVSVALLDGTGTAFSQIACDLPNCSFTQSLGTSGTVQSIGDGWYRVGLIGNTVSGQVGIRVYVGNASGATNYSGNAETIALWRMQVCANTNIPHATVWPTTTPDSTNYPVQSADVIPVKFGQYYLYNWAANTAAEFLSAATSPTLANYQANVNIDQNSANTNSYSVEATDSQLGTWQGMIFERTRTWVKAR